jgi:hypothetical protein
MGIYRPVPRSPDTSLHILPNHAILRGGGTAANELHQSSLTVPTESDIITVSSTSVDSNHEWVSITSSIELNTYMNSTFEQCRPNNIQQYRRSSHPLYASLPPNITSKIKAICNLPPTLPILRSSRKPTLYISVEHVRDFISAWLG